MAPTRDRRNFTDIAGFLRKVSKRSRTPLPCQVDSLRHDLGAARCWSRSSPRRRSRGRPSRAAAPPIRWATSPGWRRWPRAGCGSTPAPSSTTARSCRRSGRRRRTPTAAALAHIYGGRASGSGPDDLGHGAARVKPARQACNVARGMSLEAPRVVTIDGVRIGVFGVAAPERVKPLRATEPAAAAKRAVATLKKGGAQVIVALCGMDRVGTRALVKGVPGVDFAIVGADVGDGMGEPEPVATLGRLADGAGGPGALRREGHARAARRRAARAVRGRGGAQARARARRSAHRDAEGAARRVEEGRDGRQGVRGGAAGGARRARGRRAASWRRAPRRRRRRRATGSLTSSVAVRRTDPARPCRRRRAQAAGQDHRRHQLRRGQGQPAPVAEAGVPTYVGNAVCEKCHKPAVAFWKNTVHASAWKTLVEVDKQYHYDCIGCHVTGWEKPGGASLGTVEKRGLVDVSCETCHGPGSQARRRGRARRAAHHRAQARPSASAPTTATPRSTRTRSRSTPYLRDILGKGHGEKARAALGRRTDGARAEEEGA